MSEDKGLPFSYPDKGRVLRDLALRVHDLYDLDFEDFFRYRTKIIKKCDKLITDIKLAENVSSRKYFTNNFTRNF